jgi:hypothetical protein
MEVAVLPRLRIRTASPAKPAPGVWLRSPSWAMRKERGEIDNRFVAECNGPDRPRLFYALAVLLTGAAGMLVVLLHVAVGVDLQKAYYIVIFSTLLQHYYLDHPQFTKLGDMLGTGDRLLAGRST